MSGMNNEQRRGLRPGELEPVFRRAGVLREALDRAKSEKAKATLIGNFLGKNMNREVSIEVSGRTGKAVLRQEPGPSKSKLYYFDVQWTEPAPVPPDNQPPDVTPVPGTASVPQAVAAEVPIPPCSPPATVTGPENSTPIAAGNNEAW
jgi:hypothetical protein